MPELCLRIRTKSPYPPAEGRVRLVATARPKGGFAIHMRFDIATAGTNPTSERSRTDPTFLANDAADGFRRATEWVEEQFEVVGFEGTPPKSLS